MMDIVCHATHEEVFGYSISIDDRVAPCRLKDISIGFLHHLDDEFDVWGLGSDIHHVGDEVHVRVVAWLVEEDTARGLVYTCALKAVAL